MLPETSLETVLESLYDGRSQQHLANDPLSFCYRYEEPADREVAALISSVFAYGAVKVIKGSLAKIFAVTGDSPAAFVDQFDPVSQRHYFKGFKHRFNNEHDLVALLWAIGRIRRYGSLEKFFCRFLKPGDVTVEAAINGFCAEILAFDYSEVFGSSGLPETSALRFLFPSPSGGSACKRLCMFLRWVARPADGIDLGLWKQVRPDQLVIPVDRHIERIGQILGLTGRRTADWKMALEITESLRNLDPSDPVKYDFSLCHLGISEGCNGVYGDFCVRCPVSSFCTIAKAYG